MVMVVIKISDDFIIKMIISYNGVEHIVPTTISTWFMISEGKKEKKKEILIKLVVYQLFLERII